MIHGYLDTWIIGYLDDWIGYFDTRKIGYLDICPHLQKPLHPAVSLQGCRQAPLPIWALRSRCMITKYPRGSQKAQTCSPIVYLHWGYNIM